MINIYKKNKEIINYLIFGVLTTVVSFVVYFIFAKVFKIDEVISNVISWFFSVLFAFITNKLYVFESKETGKKTLLKEIISFYLARLFTGVVCDLGVFALMVKTFKINDVLSKLVTQVIVIVLNYVLSKLIVFKQNK